MDNDHYQSAFDEIVELNQFDSDVEVETKDTQYSYPEALELNYVLTSVTQQIASMIIDMINDEEIGWLDEKGGILLRELNKLCENVIDRMYTNECDECGESDGED